MKRTSVNLEKSSLLRGPSSRRHRNSGSKIDLNSSGTRKNFVIQRISLSRDVVIKRSDCSYISDIVKPYVPNRNLRSSSQRMILPPKCKLKTGGERTFSFQSAKTWNALPLAVTRCQKLSSFKSNLKTYYFKKSFP